MAVGHTKAAPVAWTRAARHGALWLTVVLLVIGAIEALTVWTDVAARGWGSVGQDVNAYVGYTRSWLATGRWYSAAELAGPFDVQALGANVYPPTLLYLTVPFALGLPMIVWWTIPAGVLVAAYRKLRPAWWTWPLLALLPAYYRTWTVVVLGNPAMWVIAFAVAGIAWGWPALLAVVKIPLGPLALTGIRHRSWWVGLPVALALCLPFGALWIDYATVLRNAHSTIGGVYLGGEWPIALVLVVAALSGADDDRKDAVLRLGGRDRLREGR